ncbi:flavin reductase family protein [Alicyclobacillus fastidiosus]|uniref:Flavin reductase family protein n=1 Tax=Alicyclobacillus fastidiosus TaxID=392011 RepID=A0ABY6ZP83_9BACL|nr:flavin reductase family protein [Alicyclobacillus fastidiosus]WAH43874.1 flavin reductase family protein [Alicyclobacillus fastidiosus]GMA60114.1 flavin reductase [Alicyclobacillus fastidiosus]
MLALNPDEMSPRDNYKFLIGSIIPRPVAFVTTKAEDGTLNAAPFSYFNIVSATPPMISVSVQRQNGVQKDTARNASFSKQFVVHICDEENVEKVNATAASLRPNESEIERVGLTPVVSTVVDVPGVREAKIRMECVLEHALALGGSTPSCDLLIGRIVQYHVEESLYEGGRVNPHGLNPVARLAGNDYVTLGNIFTIARPK